MTNPANLLIGLDHVMIAVADHDIACNRYERLGFTLRGVRENAPMGGAAAGGRGGSNVIVLSSRTPGAANYLELSYTDPQTASPLMRAILGSQEGGAMLVHATSDAARLHGEWGSAGFPLAPLISAEMPATPTAPAQVMRIIIPMAEAQPILCNAVEYGSLADYEVPALQDHANGALAWTELACIIPAERFDDVVAIYTLLYGTQPEYCCSGDQDVAFAPADARLRLMTPQAFDRVFPAAARPLRSLPAMAVITLWVRDLAMTAAHLNDADVPFHREAARIIVGPAQACGIALAFVEQQ